MNLVYPEVDPAGVEGDLPPLANHSTRALQSNRGKRRRDTHHAPFEAFAANAAKMAAAVCVDSSSRELANMSETLKNLRAAGADARFTVAVELKLEQLLMPPAGAPMSSGNNEASGTAAEALPRPVPRDDDAALDAGGVKAESFL